MRLFLDLLSNLWNSNFPLSSFRSLVLFWLVILETFFFLVSLRFEYFLYALIPSPSFLYLFQIDRLVQILVHHYGNNYFHLEFMILIFKNFYSKTNLPSNYLQIFTKIFKPSCEYIPHSLKVVESIVKLLVFLKKNDKNLC